MHKPSCGLCSLEGEGEVPSWAWEHLSMQSDASHWFDESLLVFDPVRYRDIKSRLLSIQSNMAPWRKKGDGIHIFCKSLMFGFYLRARRFLSRRIASEPWRGLRKSKIKFPQYALETGRITEYFTKVWHFFTGFPTCWCAPMHGCQCDAMSNLSENTIICEIELIPRITSWVTFRMLYHQ